jgi:hypothetical protein
LRFFSAFTLAALCIACSSEPDPGVAGPPPRAHLRLYRITERQYRQELLDVLGVDDALGLQVPYDTPANGFTSIGAGQNGISSIDTDLYGTDAYRVADWIVADPARARALAPCDAGDDACFRDSVEALLTRLFRHPVTDAQRTAFRSLEVIDGAGHVDPSASLRAIVGAALQSPAFLYRLERGGDRVGDGGDHVLDSYDQAARLAAFFWGSGPDAELYAAAAAGDALSDAQIERMATSPRFESSMFRFLAELFQLDTVLTTPKGALYFGITDADRIAMRTEGSYLLHEIAAGGDFRRLYTTNDTYVTPELATLYGIDGAPTGAGTLSPDLGRGGVLGRSLFLMVNSHATSTSPTLRGKFIRTRLLCESIPSPPPGATADLTEHEGDAPTTLRQRLETMHAQGGCATCHSRMDPLGFALEHFDVYGRHRDAEENGLPIDSTATLDGVAVDGADELGAAIARHPELGPCMTRQMFRYALGRTEYEDEEAELASLAQQFAEDGYELPALARAIARSPSFHTVRLDAPEQP